MKVMTHFVLFILELVKITEAKSSYWGLYEENEVLPTSSGLH
jgi:hypothetical protein